MVTKFSVATFMNFRNGNMKPGLGVLMSTYAYHAIHSAYGHPVSYMLFGRIG